MPDINNPYDAVIADLEAKRSEIDAAIALMKRLKDTVGAAPSTSVPFSVSGAYMGGTTDLSTIPSDAFFGLTIADAAIKFLAQWGGRKPQNTNTIIDALEHGGLKRAAYTTVYGILNRRAKRQGDVVNVKGDWGLAEWYGPPKTKAVPPRVRLLPPEDRRTVREPLAPPPPEPEDEKDKAVV